MKKIPTLFRRVFEDHKVVDITPDVPRWLQWVMRGEGYPTVKMDGACCAIINGKFYKRFDAKQGKPVPQGAIPCCDPDSVTGHWPHWIPVSDKNPADRWFIAAYNNTYCPTDGTYEAIGFHFQGNPYHMKYDILEPHGCRVIKDLDRSFAGINNYLTEHNIEGIVFWKDDKPVCKIKRSDFGLPWGQRERKRK